jgi:CRISPR-associated endonuclease/helicase Cas3
MKNYFKYWGKAAGDKENGELKYHFLVYHCLDVAAVGRVLLERNSFLFDKISSLTSLKSDVLFSLMIFCLLLHDVGKFSEVFQNIFKDRFKEIFGFKSGKTKYSRRDFGHDSMGFLIWTDVIYDLMKEKYGEGWTGIVEDVLKPALGHHGQPVKSGRRNLNDYCSSEDKVAVSEFINEAVSLSGIEVFLKETAPTIDEKRLAKSTWLLAGFYTLCDWIGSNRNIFKYKTIGVNKSVNDLNQYWSELAFPRAEEAINNAGILPCKSEKQLSPLELLSHLPRDAQLTPIQREVSSLKLVKTPQLFIIEDATGAGKTEAALILCHRLMSQGCANGFYLALPTMATSDGIFPRVQKTYDNFYAEGEKPSLVLTHSTSKLRKEFTDTIIFQTMNDEPQNYGDDASSRCQAWLTDNRKKSLLAHIGVGTIDQAFLSILQNKYMTLRLIGLLGKILVIDEAHAYDAYMTKELEILLLVHAELGGSAIVMSATLPYSVRQKLVKAFSEGANIRDYAIKNNQKYPLLTHIAQDVSSGSRELHRPEWKLRERKQKVEFLHDMNEVKNIIEESLRSGKCVCWIRNSVKDARQAFVELGVLEPELFHARYTVADRLAIQKRVINSFDDKSAAKGRKSKLIIATQVIEQSLDLDFDVMITDLSPMDIILQRAGRQRRHIRDKDGNRKSHGEDERGTPTFYILSPEFESSPGKDWIKNFFPNSHMIYRNHARLWLTLKELINLPDGELRFPDHFRSLVETVYDENYEFPDTDFFQTDIKDTGKQSAEGCEARFATINYDAGYRFENTTWPEDIHAPTRLGEETTTLTLAKWNNGQITPFNQTDEHPWRNSEVTVCRKYADEEILNEEQQAAWNKIKQTLPAKGKWITLLPVTWDDATQRWRGNIKDQKGKFNSIQYCSKQGLIFAHEQDNHTEKTE